jgi:Na+-driven multidrug efflux pump
MFTVGALPVAAIWSQTDVALEYLLRIDHETSQLACIWSNILALGMWPSMITEAFKKWLQCQASCLLLPNVSVFACCAEANIVCVRRMLYGQSQHQRLSALSLSSS